MEICPNITVREYVCPHMYAAFGDRAIRFIPEKTRILLNWARNDVWKVPIIINNAAMGLTQRGVRCNICQLVADKTKVNKLYLSAHNFAAGFDGSSTRMTADEMRDAILKNANKAPFKLRLESAKCAPTWCHTDYLCEYDQKEMVRVFDA